MEIEEQSIDSACLFSYFLQLPLIFSTFDTDIILTAIVIDKRRKVLKLSDFEKMFPTGTMRPMTSASKFISQERITADFMSNDQLMSESERLSQMNREYRESHGDGGPPTFQNTNDKHTNTYRSSQPAHTCSHPTSSDVPYTGES